MKKQLTATFVFFLIIFSINSFAQVDSSKIASTQRQIDKDQKKAGKLDQKAKRQEEKQKRHENKMIRKEKKRERKLNSIQKNEKKLEELKKDSTSTGATRIIHPFAPTQRQDFIPINGDSFLLKPGYKKFTYDLKSLDQLI